MTTIKQILTVLLTLLLGGGAFPVATESSEGETY